MRRQHCVAVLLCCLSADGLLRPPSPPPARRAVRLQSTTLDPETVAALGLSDASCDVDDDAPSALPAAVATARDSGGGGGGGLLEVQLWPTLVKAMDHTLLTRGQEGELCAQSRLFQEMQKTRATLTNVLGRAPTDSEWCAACGHAGPPSRFRADRCRALAARQAMASNNLKLVLSVATGLRRHELRKPLGRRLDQIPSLNELVGDGVAGLLTALDRFDETRGLRFSTYATYYVANAVRESLRRSQFVVVSPKIEARMTSIASLRRDANNAGREISNGEIGDALGLSEKLVADATRFETRVRSLDALLYPGSNAASGTIGGDGSSSVDLSGTIPSKLPTPTEAAELVALRDTLEKAMRENLTSQQRKVVRARLGLDTGVPRSMKQVGAQLSLDPHDVGTTYRNAIRQLGRSALVVTELRAFMDDGELTKM